MNGLIALASLLAVASAAPGLAGLGYSGLGSYYGAYATPYGGHYAGAYAGQHAGPPGSDTLEVTIAKQAHFAAHAEANARNHGIVGHAAPLAYAGYAHASPLAYAHASPIAYGAHALPAAYGTTRLIDPVAIAHGAPLPTGDTVEVAAAKVAHFNAHAAASAGHVYGRYKRGLIASPLAYSGYGHGSHAVAYNAPLVAAHHPVAHHAVAYNAPLVHAAHPIAHHAVAYNAPLVHAAHPIAHHAIALPAAHSYSSVSHVSHSHPAVHYAHHY